MKVNHLKVENICDFIGGSQPPKSKFINEPQQDYVRLIQTRDYKTDTFPTYIPKNSTKKFCDEQDIMIGRYGPPIFQICRGLKGAYNVALLKAMPKMGIDREFLYYFLKQESVFQYVDKLSARTGGQTGIDLVSLNKYPVSVPANIKDQKKLVASLYVIDKKINLNNLINIELEAMAKTIYDYWFVQFDFPDANGKPYKTSGGKMVYNSTLKREIPDGWTDATIGQILDKVPASTRVNSTSYSITGLTPVIDQGQDYICGYTDDTDSIVPVNDAHIIFGDHTRTVKLVNFNYARGADGTQILISNSKRVPNYLFYQMISAIDLSNYGYARHYKFLKECKILVPNEAVATKFTNIVCPLFEKRKHNIFENIELANLRDWLLPMLMNGQVTVK